MRHWREKEFDFFGRELLGAILLLFNAMRNALEAKERFPKLNQSFSNVFFEGKVQSFNRRYWIKWVC